MPIPDLHIVPVLFKLGGKVEVWVSANLVLFLSFMLFCVHVHACGRSENRLLELDLSFHSVGSGAQTQVLRLGAKCCYLLSLSIRSLCTLSH